MNVKLSYDERMNPDTKTSNTPFANFTRAMDHLMAVPRSEIKKALDQEKLEKAERKRAKTSPASDHASEKNG
jgi:hypothetical protein